MLVKVYKMTKQYGGGLEFIPENDVLPYHIEHYMKFPFDDYEFMGIHEIPNELLSQLAIHNYNSEDGTSAGTCFSATYEE